MKSRAGPQAFPKSLRLLRRAEFRRVYDEGQRRSASLCSIFFRANGLPQTRLGITTPRAVGKAVVRNRIRRRLREVFRLHRHAIPPGWDVVLNPGSAVAKIPFTRLEREIMRLFPSRQPWAGIPTGSSPIENTFPPGASSSEESRERPRKKEPLPLE